ncbi:hypothetical protein AAVH_13413 [Aphelenchoides avenae]|nr:hypothetical protein AAVH_13413 [Aphelenchus avenae]
MNVPGEVMVDVVHCVDYGTLYALTFVNSQFHNVSVRNAEKLAKRRNFELTISDATLHLVVDGSIQLPSIVLDERTISSVLEALKAVANVVGLHAVTKLSLEYGDWFRLPPARMFAVLPAVEYATNLSLRYAPPLGTPERADYVDAFVADFPHTQELELELLRPFDWTYLRRRSALKLGTFRVLVCCESPSSEAEVLRYCMALSRLPENEQKRFFLISPFPTDRFRQEEVERVVEVLSEAQCEAELVLPTGSHLQLSERNFTPVALKVDAKKFTLFASRNANVAVCVMDNGCSQITNNPRYFRA